jgi:hypothetical protein
MLNNAIPQKPGKSPCARIDMRGTKLLGDICGWEKLLPFGGFYIEQHADGWAALLIARSADANNVVWVGVIAVFINPRPRIPSTAICAWTLPRFQPAFCLSLLHHSMSDALDFLVERFTHGKKKPTHPVARGGPESCTRTGGRTGEAMRAARGS